MSKKDSYRCGESFSRTQKIDCLLRTVDVKENNISDRREGIAMNPVSISQNEASLSKDFAKMHEASCIVCHRENDIQARELR